MIWVCIQYHLCVKCLPQRNKVVRRVFLLCVQGILTLTALVFMNRYMSCDSRVHWLLWFSFIPYSSLIVHGSHHVSESCRHRTTCSGSGWGNAQCSSNRTRICTLSCGCWPWRRPPRHAPGPPAMYIFVFVHFKVPSSFSCDFSCAPLDIVMNWIFSSSTKFIAWSPCNASEHAFVWPQFL